MSNKKNRALVTRGRQALRAAGFRYLGVVAELDGRVVCMVAAERAQSYFDALTKAGLGVEELEAGGEIVRGAVIS